MSRRWCASRPGVPGGRVGICVLPAELLLVALQAGSLFLFGLVGALLDEPDGGRDVERELEELGLPVSITSALNSDVAR
jgi:hypothetical protein